MRACEGLEIVLPTLRLAFATASRLADVRNAAAGLPLGWSLNDADPTSILVMCDEDMDGVAFLVSEDTGLLELHAVIDEELVLLSRRRTGGLHVLQAA